MTFVKSRGPFLSILSYINCCSIFILHLLILGCYKIQRNVCSLSSPRFHSFNVFCMLNMLFYAIPCNSFSFSVLFKHVMACWIIFSKCEYKLMFKDISNSWQYFEINSLIMKRFTMFSVTLYTKRLKHFLYFFTSKLRLL